MKADFSSTQNDQFTKEVLQLPRYLLDDAVTWIQDNMEPEDVFDEGVLRGSISYLSAPEDVFSKEVLEDWALQNGFEKTE